MADIVGAAIRARQLGFDETQGFFDQAARRRAGQAMAGGDVQGAAGELYGAGMLDAGMALEGEQQRRAAAERQQAQQDRLMAQQQQQQNAVFMKNAATVLRRIPQDRRAATFTDQIAPVLKAMGAEDQALAQMVNYLDDTSLDTFIGEVEKNLQIVNRGGGGYDVVDTRTGEAVRSVEPEMKAPQGFRFGPDGELELIPGYAAGKGAVATATRAPPRPRAGSGGRVSSAGVSGLPSGFVLD